MKKIYLVLTLLLVVGQAGPEICTTAGSRDALVVNPYKQYLYLPQCDDAVSNLGGEVVRLNRELIMHSPTSPTIPEFVAALEGRGTPKGHFMIAAHGGDQMDDRGVGIECYCPDSLGESMCWAQYNMYEDDYPGQLYVALDVESHAWAIYMRWDAMVEHADFAPGAIADISCCYGGTCPRLDPDVDAQLGVLVSTFGGWLNENANAIWGGMNGDDNAVYGIKNRQLRHCIENATFIGHLEGDNLAKTLSPSPYKRDVWDGCIVGPAGISARFIFDTSIEISDPMEAAEIFGDGLMISSAYVEEDSIFVVEVVPNEPWCYWETEADLVIYHNKVESAENSLVTMDGNGHNGPSNFEVRLVFDANGAAVVGGFQVNPEGQVKFNVESESFTVGWQIRGTNGGEPTALAELPPGSGKRYVVVEPGWEFYELVELEHKIRLRQIVRETVSAEDFPTPTQQIQKPTEEELLASLDTKKQHRKEYVEQHPEPPRNQQGLYHMAGKRVLIVTVAEFETYLNDYLKWFWDSYGLEVDVLVVNPGGYLETIQYIRNQIATWYDDNSIGVHLVGAGSNQEWWSGEQSWVWETGNWPTIKSGLLQYGFPPEGDPHLKLVPTDCMPDTCDRGENIGYFEPVSTIGDYYLYGDCNYSGSITVMPPSYER